MVFAHCRFELGHGGERQIVRRGRLMTRVVYLGLRQQAEAHPVRGSTVYRKLAGDIPCLLGVISSRAKISEAKLNSGQRSPRLHLIRNAALPPRVARNGSRESGLCFQQ